MGITYVTCLCNNPYFICYYNVYMCHVLDHHLLLALGSIFVQEMHRHHVMASFLGRSISTNSGEA